MSETSPTYRTGDSGDEQPEDWGGTLLPVPPVPPTPLTDAELAAIEARCTAPRAGGWHDLLENPLELRYERTIRLLQDAVRALLAEVRRLQWENAALYTEMDAWRGTVARWAGVPYTPEGKVR